jgi:hypothetical protein
MPLDDTGSASVRPATETRCADFAGALDATLASLDKIVGSSQRAREFARARREILAAADATMKAEKRRIVAALTPAWLRKEVRELIDSHEALLDYIDDLERQPVIAGEVQRLRSRGEIPWPL